MGWQATGDPRPGGKPGRQQGPPAPEQSLPGLPAGFGHGGGWAEAVPSAALAAALEQAAGPEDFYDGAGTDALVGIARQWAAVESWAAAGKLATLRAMTREDADGTPRLRRRMDLPDGWDDSLTYEISGALAMGPVSADNLACLAWTLGTRLPGIGRLLADGTLTLSKAKLVAQLFGPLDEEEAARAEALIAGELAGKTYPQVERLAWRAALAVAPDAAERRRSTAEREQARVTVFREESGAVGLSGRDLPAAEALVLAHARALLAGSPEGMTDYIDADLRATGSVLERAADVLDFKQPVAVMLLGILQGIPDEDEPGAIIARLMDAVPPGSYLALSQIAGDVAADEVAEGVQRYNQQAAAPVAARTHAEASQFFTGLELVEPGVVQVHRWRPGPGDPGTDRNLAIYGGVGRKP